MDPSCLFDLTDHELRGRSGLKWPTVDPDVLPAWVAEMDVRLAPAITERLQRALESHDAGYPGRMDGLREAFAAFATERWDWSPAPQDITVHVGVAAAGQQLMRHLAGPDHGVVIMPPVYNAFYRWLDTAGLRPVEVPLLDVDSGGSIDLDGVRAAVASGTRVVLLCNPHNPLGRVFSRDELADVADLAAEHGATVIADEIHAPLAHPGVDFMPYLTVSDAARATGIALHSASKSWNTAGLKCGFAVRHPDGPWPDAVDPEESTIEAGLWGVLAAEAAFRDGTDWLDAVRTHLAEQTTLLQRLLQTHLPGVHCHPPRAGYLAWLDFRETTLWRSDAPQDPAEYFLERARVALSPGTRFGEAGAGGARINLGTSAERLERIVCRMGAALDRTHAEAGR